MRAGTNTALQVEQRLTTDVVTILEQKLLMHRNLLRYITTACEQGLVEDANPAAFILELVKKSDILQA